MTVTADLGASWSGVWERSPISGADLKRSGASWSGAIALHLAVAIAAIAIVPESPPPKPQIDAVNVQIVTATPQPSTAEVSGVENGASAEPQASSPAPQTAPTPRFEVALQDRSLERLPAPRFDTDPQGRPWQDVLALAEQARRGEPIPEIDPIILPAHIQAALRGAYYCRTAALGIAAETARCPPALDQFELEARIAALEVEVRRRLAADGMRDRYFDD